MSLRVILRAARHHLQSDEQPFLRVRRSAAATAVDAHDVQLLAKLKRLYGPEEFIQIRWQLENLPRLRANRYTVVLRKLIFVRIGSELR